MIFLKILTFLECFTCENLKYIILDYSFRDMKNNSILTSKESRKAVIDFLTSKTILENMAERKTKICFY